MVLDFIQQTIERRHSDIMSFILKQRPEEKKKEWQIQISDKCDRCNAQAYVMIKGSTGSLLFCGHHYEGIMNNPDAYNKMMSFMLEIIDEREHLAENKLIGSHN